MSAAYLYFNAALYAGFAILCLARAGPTARAIGYLQLSPSGESEYRVVYVGLQIGLAVVFWYLASRSEVWRLGISFSLAIYLPLVIVRLATVVRFWPVSTTTMTVAVLEATLLAVALVIYLIGR